MNRRSLLATQAVAVGGARAHIDEQAHRVQLFLNSPSWPPLASSTCVGGQPQPWPVGNEWHFPRDASQMLTGGFK